MFNPPEITSFIGTYASELFSPFTHSFPPVRIIIADSGGSATADSVFMVRQLHRL